uniref:Peptidase A1 domain-containing protein n=1 Tax=Arundo donax TaxID=35708 RepID=A0A0A8XZY7_ARUDO
MFIDSGVSFTMLPEQVLRNITEHVNKLMKMDPKYGSNNNKFTCYDVVELPKDMQEMVLHFCDGAQLVIPVDNYMYLDQADKEYCLVFKKAPEMYPRMSILGNFQQQNMRMLFDVKGETLSFTQYKGCQAEKKQHAAV